MKPMQFENPGWTSNKKPLPRNESALNRVIGVSQEIEKEVQEDIREHSFRTEKYQTKEFTPEMREAIGQINKLLKRFLFTYGLREFVEIVPENIEYVDCEGDSDATVARKDQAGHYRPNDNKIALFTDWEQGNYRQFIKVLVHEMIHMQAFQSFEVVPESGDSWVDWYNHHYDERTGKYDFVDLRRRRVGIELTQYDGVLAFSWLNEGVTEELTKLFMRKQEKNIDILKATRRPTVLYEKFKQFDRKMATQGKEDGHSYKKERDKLNQIVDTIFRHGKGEYKNRDEVFKLFTRAALNGRLLPLARAIEKAEGRGMFRKLAELDAKDL